ncbi:peptidoglycan-binding protein [Floridanema aerugineum]|uniref:Peptidoglycan-binding protein n=1 Tax=Floridaenema aerugineum BLCC-F46 TaxID=3153654 RepID=A0ABV4X1T2_9CYAN
MKKLSEIKHFPKILNPKRWSITAKISTALVVAAVLPIALITTYNFRENEKNTTKREYDNLSLLAQGLADRLDQLLIDNQLVVKQLSGDSEIVDFLLATPEEQKSRLPQINQMLENFRVSSPSDDFETVYLLNKKGEIIAIPPTKKHIKWQNTNCQIRQYFQKAIAGELYISTILTGLTGGEPGLYFSSPIRKVETIKEGDTGKKVRQLEEQLQKRGFAIKSVNNVYDANTAAVVREFQKSHNLAITGRVDAHTWKELIGTENNSEILGVAVLEMKANAIWKIVNSLNVGKEHVAFLVDREGIVIAYPNKSFLYKSLEPLSPEALKRVSADRGYPPEKLKQDLGFNELAQIIKSPQKPHQGEFSDSKENGKKIVSSTTMKNPYQQWTVGVIEPKQQLLDHLYNLRWKTYLAGIVVTSGAALGALLLAKSMVKPIGVLTKTATELEKGNYDLEPLNQVSKSEDDIGNLVRVFSKMAEEVKAREQKLKQQLVELQIEIDQAKKERQVAEITETDYFQELQKKAKQMRRKNSKSQES